MRTPRPKSFDFIQDALRGTVARTLVLSVNRCHRSGIVQEYDEMLVDAGWSDASACEDQRKRESGEAFEDEACRDRQFRDFAAALRRLLHDLPEEQSCDGSWRKASPEQMDCDDGRDGQ
jgi:hypothetical protein